MLNKKKIIICIMLLVITINVIVLVNPLKINKEKEDTNNMLSILIEDTKGVYIENKEVYPKEGYDLNKVKSYCEKSSKLLWDKNTKKLKVKSTESDKCYLYFDKERTGTENDPYEIQTIEDLLDLSNEVNNGDTKSGKYYVLVRDLDFNDSKSYEDSSRTDYGDINGINNTEPLLTELTTGSGFEPIGYNNSFQGIFDGNNNQIKSLYIDDKESEYKFLGLFGLIENAIIKNIGVSGSVHSLKANETSGLIGRMVNSKIINCYNEAKVTKDFNDWSTGGIVGSLYGTITISNTHNSGNISGGGWIGGIVGGFGDGNLTIENSYNEGNIIRNGDGNISGIGGMVGAALPTDQEYSITIRNTHNSGNIIDNPSSDRESYNGGLIGRSGVLVNIENSYNLGNVKINRNYTHNHYNAEYNAGLIGFLYAMGNSKIISSYNSGTINNSGNIAGLIGSTDGVNLIIDKSFNVGKIENTNTNPLDLRMGGLIGYAARSYVSILNSYNANDLICENGYEENRYFIGGLIGPIDFEGKYNIINSYNVGNIKSGYYANGITYVYGSLPSVININNVYNYGDLKGATNSVYGIGYVNPNSNTGSTFNNMYYKPGVTGFNLDTNLQPINNINSEEFVSTLNDNIKSINLSSIDASLEGYKLSKWKLGKDGYPILDGGFIPDLSNSKNNGTNYSVSENNEGLIPNTDDKT